MKIIVSAIALAFAMPAVAQNAPQPQQQGHSQHHQGGAATDAQTDHSGHQMPAGKPHDHNQGHAMKDGCCADKDGNGKMDCCEKMAAKKEGGCCGGDAAAKPKPKRPPHEKH